MNNKCKHLKQKFNRKLKCNRTNKEITLHDCIECKKIAIKEPKTNKYIKKQKVALKRTKTPLKQKSNKLAKLEKNRQSVFTNDLTKCIECKEHKIDKKKDDIHECIRGSNRLNSIRYNLCVPFCRECHENKEILLKWLFKAQRYYVKNYGYDEFMRTFKIDYIEKHKKSSMY